MFECSPRYAINEGYFTELIGVKNGEYFNFHKFMSEHEYVREVPVMSDDEDEEAEDILTDIFLDIMAVTTAYEEP